MLDEKVRKTQGVKLIFRRTAHEGEAGYISNDTWPIAVIERLDRLIELMEGLQGAIEKASTLISAPQTD